jgi:putative endonuclease
MDPSEETKIGIGKRGEELAVRHLEDAGYRIIERNYRCLLGEIDVVARDGESLVFVEVKSRRGEGFGDPQEAVGPRKQKKISRIAQYYLKEKRLRDVRARFDVVAVRIMPGGSRIKVIQNAFELAYGW